MLGSVRAAVVSGGSLAHIGAPTAGSFTLSADMEVTGCTIYTTPFDGGISVGTRIGVSSDLAGVTTIPWLASGLSTTDPGSGSHPVTVEFEHSVILLAGVVYCITGDCDIMVANGSSVSGLVATNEHWLSGHPFSADTGAYRVPFELYGFAPPGTAVSDAFTRANSTSVLGNADTGQAWSVLSGTWGIDSNQAYISNGSTQSYAVIDSTLADCIISVKLNGTLSSGGGITFRALDVSHLWFTEVVSGTSYLYRCNGGGPSMIADMGVSWSVGDVMTIALRGSSIVVKKNGTQVFTYTDSTFSTYTKHGLRDYGGVIRLDDFSVQEDPLSHVTGSAPVDVSSSSVAEYRGVRVSGLAPVDVFTSSRTPNDFEAYPDADTIVRVETGAPIISYQAFDGSAYKRSYKVSWAGGPVTLLHTYTGDLSDDQWYVTLESNSHGGESTTAMVYRDSSGTFSDYQYGTDVDPGEYYIMTQNYPDPDTDPPNYVLPDLPTGMEYITYYDHIVGSSEVLIPFELSGLMDPLFPPSTPPVDFDGLPDPTVAPTLAKSNTSDGHLATGTYRYSYAAWKGTRAQATAPSPTAEITLSTENTVTLTYPIIDGADGYLVYREDL